jgi:LysM repeat protein
MTKKTFCGMVLLAAVMMGTGGCVMREQYEAEKNRALNFQRLLAQEEKRTGELDNEARRLKRDLPDLEAKNRELMAQVQAVREQMGRIQEENAALREAAALKAREEASLQEPKAKAPRKAAPKVARPSPEPHVPIIPIEPEAAVPVAPEVPVASGGAVYHEVKPGDTLFRLARQYGVQVDKIREWNHLKDNIIEVGQKLIVGQE